MKASRIGAADINPVSAGNWIRRNTDRINLLTDANLGSPMLSLLEAFLLVRWKPLFEGRTDGN
jgi:hypothetical protein